MWRCGPDCLKSSLSLNDAYDTTEMPKECYKEYKISNKKTHTLAATGAGYTVGDLVEHESFRKLVRVTAYFVRVVEMFKSKNANQSSGCYLMLNAGGSKASRVTWITRNHLTH